MIDINSMNNNLPTYFKALDSSNSNSNQTILSNTSPKNNDNKHYNENGQKQIDIRETSLNTNNNNVLQFQNTVPSSNLINTPQSIVQQQSVLQPIDFNYNKPINPKSIMPTISVLDNNIQNISNSNPNLINSSNNIHNEYFQSQPSPYNNNTIVSPMGSVTISTPPQYTVFSKNMNTLAPPSNNYMNQAYTGNTTPVMFPPVAIGHNMNHAYSAPVFSNSLSPYSLPNCDMNSVPNCDMNSGLRLNINIPSHCNSLLSTPNVIQTPIISSSVLPNPNINTPIISSNNIILSNDINTPVITTDLSTSIDISTPLVVNSSMPVLSNDISTPLQNTNTPIVPSSLFNVTTHSSINTSNANSSLVIPSDLNTGISLSNQQVASIDSLSPPNTVTPVIQSVVSSINVPTIKSNNYNGIEAEEVSLKIGETPSAISKDFINSFPTPTTDIYSMKCVMNNSLNKEGINLENNTEASLKVKSVDMMIPITPKDEMAKMIGNNSNISYSLPHSLNKKGVLDKEDKTSSSQTPVISNQNNFEFKPTKEETKPNPFSTLNTPPQNKNIAKASVIPTPKDTPATIVCLNNISSVMHSPIGNSFSEEVEKSILKMQTNTIKPISQNRHKIKKKTQRININLSPNVFLSSFVDTIDTIKSNNKNIKNESSEKKLTISDNDENVTLSPKFDDIPMVHLDNTSTTALNPPVISFNTPITNPKTTSSVEPEPKIILNNDSKKIISKYELKTDKIASETTPKENVETSKKVVKSLKNEIPMTEPSKFTEPVISAEPVILTEPPVFIEPINENENKKIKTENILLKNIRGKNGNGKRIIDLLKEADIKNKSQSFAYTKYLLEQKFSYNKSNIRTKFSILNKKSTSNQNTNNDKDNNIEINKQQTNLDQIVPFPSPAITKPKNYTEPIPYIDDLLFGDDVKDEFLAIEVLLNNHDKNISYDELLNEINNITSNSESVISKLSSSDDILNDEDIKSENKGCKKRKSNITGVKRKNEEDLEEEESLTSKKFRTEKANESGFCIEDEKRKDSTKQKGEKKKKYSKSEINDKRRKNKDVSENGVISKVKYNSNNILFYESEVKALIQHQTKDDEDIYPLKCACEGDLDDKDVGLENLVCPYPNCSKSFVKSIHLEKHFAEHGEDFRPFQCPDCTKNFRRRYDLMRHSRIHNEIVPYRCSRCLRGFTRSDSCARHTKTRQCHYYDINSNLDKKKENPPFYCIVKDPLSLKGSDIIVKPLSKEK